MEVIPAIDLLDGRVVRLRQGRYDEVTVYSDEPEAIAAQWRTKVHHVHVVDLEGARQGRPVQRDLIRRLVEASGGGLQAGGGIRSVEAAESYFALGVERVVLGTAAIVDPGVVHAIAERWPGRVVVAVDARGGKVATDGWLKTTSTDAVSLVKSLAEVPICAVLYTDIERDGTEVGPNVPETARLARDGGLPVIASGGVGTLEHLRALCAAGPGIIAAILGRALHERRFTLDEAVAAAAGQ